MDLSCLNLILAMSGTSLKKSMMRLRSGKDKLFLKLFYLSQYNLTLAMFRTSLMDRQAKKLQSVRDEGRFGEEPFNENSDEEDKEVREIFIGN